MKDVRSFNVKQLCNALLSCHSQSEFDSLWNSIIVLRAHGFLSYEDWDRFYDRAGRLYYEPSLDRVIDSGNIV